MSANRSPVHRYTTLLLLTVGIALHGAGMASAKPKRAPAKVSKQDAGLEIPRPEIGPGMLSPDRWAFTAAFKTAVRRIHGSESCGDLFAGLDLRGIEALSGTRYEPARSPADLALCQGGVSAVTSVHGRRTRLCYRFKILSRNDKAAILIHEALHAAGLGEWPQEPEAATSNEITAMVKGACEL